MINRTSSLDQLKSQCRDLGLPVSGTRADLISRLERAEIDRLTIPAEVEVESRQSALTISDQARAFTITTDDDYAAAGEFLTGVVKAALKQLDDAFDPIIRSWHDGHKQTLATKKILAAPFLEAESIVKSLMATYHRELQERQRQEQARIAQALQEEAENRALEEAQALFKQGEDGAAEEVLESLSRGEVEAVTAPPPMVYRTPKASGVGVKMVKKFRVTDPTKIKRSYLVPDMAAIQKVVMAFGKGAEGVVGGIEFYEEANVSARVR